MNKLICKLKKIIGISDETYLNLNNFMVGNSNYIIFELPKNKEIIRNNLLTLIMNNLIDFYWFKSYEDFEKYADLLMVNKKEVFIIIG